MSPDVEEPLGFDSDIKPVFRQRDRQSMLSHFDLWSHADVGEHADAILARLRAGTMPCDGAWPDTQVDFFHAGSRAVNRRERRRR